VALELEAAAQRVRAGSRIVIWCGSVDSPLAVAGVPLWRRAIYTACRAGFERLVIVTPGSAAAVEHALAGDHRLADRKVDVVPVSEGWGLKLDGVPSRWVVLNDQWVVDAELLVELAASTDGPAAASLDGPFAADQETLQRFIRDGWRPSHAPMVPVGCRIEKPPVYVRVTNATGVAAAEDALFQSLARNDNNFFARYVDRVLSRALSRRLAPTPITPNQITIFSVAIGILGSLLLVHPSYLAGAVGTFLFLASTIIDGCDGEIARLKFQESPLGAKLDLIGDNLVHVFLFPCVGLRFWLHGDGDHFLAFGIVTLAGVGATWIAIYRYVLRPDPARGVIPYFEAFANREFAYLLFALALIGRLDWFVWAMTIGIWAFPVGLVILDTLDRRS
jgi:phosphatidylglycerophosphate synthase